MSIERRCNRNEVSRESPHKEVNRRHTSLKKFTADALRGPRVSIATGWNIKSGGREEYLVSFLAEAVSAALPAEWDVECRYESARLLTTVIIITGLSSDAGAVAEFAGPLSSVARQEPRLLGPVALHLGRRLVLLDPDVVAGLQLRTTQR